MGSARRCSPPACLSRVVERIRAALDLLRTGGHPVSLRRLAHAAEAIDGTCGQIRTASRIPVEDEDGQVDIPPKEDLRKLIAAGLAATLRWDPPGLLWAVLLGGLADGARAASVQLSVPVGESLSLRLAQASAAMLGGIAMVD